MSIDHTNFASTYVLDDRRRSPFKPIEAGYPKPMPGGVRV
jgi:hypothetical protein